ncbi:MAG: addiction module protein [Desulfobulbaceae bacterium]|nr:addiction module protein [Desulfobulbaceae bacterium]
MPMNLEECERQARQLPPTDRSVLIEHLIGSLDELDEAECERLWLEEAERRFQEYKAGNITSRPAEDVFRDARAKLREIK